MATPRFSQDELATAKRVLAVLDPKNEALARRIDEIAQGVTSAPPERQTMNPRTMTAQQTPQPPGQQQPTPQPQPQSPADQEQQRQREEQERRRREEQERRR